MLVASCVGQAPRDLVIRGLVCFAAPLIVVASQLHDRPVDALVALPARAEGELVAAGGVTDRQILGLFIPGGEQRGRVLLDGGRGPAPHAGARHDSRNTGRPPWTGRAPEATPEKRKRDVRAKVSKLS